MTMAPLQWNLTHSTAQKKKKKNHKRVLDPKMEISFKLNFISRHHPLKSNWGASSHEEILGGGRHHHHRSLGGSSWGTWRGRRQPSRVGLLVVEAKGKKPMMYRGYQRQPPPPLPKIEDDGNPKFVIFVRNDDVYLWFPLTLITGGTTAKIMLAAKDNFLGKYIYKDTLARNLAAVIYRDEKDIQKTARKQFRPLQSAFKFRYGYKLVDNNNLRAAFSPKDVIELPTQAELKTVLDKVKDFFGDAKESFGKITALNLADAEEAEQPKVEKSKVEG